MGTSGWFMGTSGWCWNSGLALAGSSPAAGSKVPNRLHMFGNWLNNQHKDFKQLIWVGVAAICWAIWKCRNDIVFKKTKFNSIPQVIFRGAYWLRFWAQLQRKEQAKDILVAMSRKLVVIALQFANEGWNNFYCLP
jgi:hypothetical protein